MTHKRRSAKILSLALSAVMLFSTMPTTVFATEGDISIGASNVECHVKHNEDCGFIEAVEGADCSHKNEDGTYHCAPVSDNDVANQQVVDLFTSLPNDSVIAAETTEEEKDFIFAQLSEAMDAFDALASDEQDLFLQEHLELYKAAMALNDAITGSEPVALRDESRYEAITIASESLNGNVV